MAGWIIWAIAAACFGALALHPFVTYPLSLLALSRWQRTPVRATGAASRPRMAICTCAYNEVRSIDAKIRNSLALREHYPELDIYLYVDRCDDGTAEIAQRYSDQIHLEIALERHGKTHGMNRLLAQCQAEVVVFSDANVMLDPNALGALATHFADPAVGCVCGHLIYTNADESITASTGSLYWRLEQFLKRQESLFGAVMGADGSIFAIRRALHVAPPDHIIDDMFVSFRILCAGYRVIQVDDVRAFEKSVTVGQEEFRRKIRIACQAFNVHRLIWPFIWRQLGPLRIYMYLSHKWLRWFSIYFLSLSYVCGLMAIASAHFYLLAGCAAVFTAGVLGMSAAWRIPVLSSMTDILVALAGAGIGVFMSLRGERFQTWQPAASIRG